MTRPHPADGSVAWRNFPCSWVSDNDGGIRRESYCCTCVVRPACSHRAWRRFRTMIDVLRWRRGRRHRVLDRHAGADRQVRRSAVTRQCRLTAVRRRRRCRPTSPGSLLVRRESCSLLPPSVMHPACEHGGSKASRAAGSTSSRRITRMSCDSLLTHRTCSRFSGPQRRSSTGTISRHPERSPKGSSSTHRRTAHHRQAAPPHRGFRSDGIAVEASDTARWRGESRSGESRREARAGVPPSAMPAPSSV